MGPFVFHCESLNTCIYERRTSFVDGVFINHNKFWGFKVDQILP